MRGERLSGMSLGMCLASEPALSPDDMSSHRMRHCRDTEQGRETREREEREGNGAPPQCAVAIAAANDANAATKIPLVARPPA